MENAEKISSKKPMSTTKRDTIAMYCFLAPVIIGYIWFTLYPTVTTIIMGLYKWDAVGTKAFIGFSNYIRMFTDDRIIMISVRVTLIYAIFSVALNMLVGFILACLLNSQRKTVGLFRTIFYIPCMIAGGTPTMVIWLWIFSKEGLLNSILKQIGITGPNWLTNPGTALSAIIFMSLWGVGGTMIIFISGLRAIPDEYFESADIDGAGYFRKMFAITLPVITPTILYNIIMGLIGSLQAFTQAFVLTSGGPQNQTTFYALHLYNQAFTNRAFGYASAMSTMLFVAIILLTFLIFKTSARWVFYGDGVEETGNKNKEIL